MKRDQRYDPDRVHELERLLIILIDDPTTYDDAHWWCDFCDSCQRDVSPSFMLPPAPFQHDLDCPVVVAQDLLTGIEEEQRR